MTENISIRLNGDAFQLRENKKTLQDLVEQMGLSNGRYAIEVNREIIPRSEHAAFALNAGDEVEVVQAIGGG